MWLMILAQSLMKISGIDGSENLVVGWYPSMIMKPHCDVKVLRSTTNRWSYAVVTYPANLALYKVLRLIGPNLTFTSNAT